MPVTVICAKHVDHKVGHYYFTTPQQVCDNCFTGAAHEDDGDALPQAGAPQQGGQASSTAARGSLQHVQARARESHQAHR